MSELLDIDLAWGGFYACISAEYPDISIIRLLDFNRDSYHATLFNKTFEEIPGAEVVEALSPFIHHAPIDAKGLLKNERMVLLCRKVLTRDCLEGYMYYLEEFGVPEDEREELTRSLIAFSKDEPLKLRLHVSNDELQIEERD
jgi:hypothetical protein